MTHPQKNCLVLGAQGFIGSHLVDALAERGHFVRSFYRESDTVPNSVPRKCHHNVENFSGDFHDEVSLRAALRGIDVCFHLVSTTLPQSSNADPEFDVRTNVLSTVRLLSLAVACGVQKVVFVSSGGTVYGIPHTLPIPETHPTEPLCSYGITKLTNEKYIALFKHLHGLDATVLRIANPFGERQRMRSGQGAVAVFLGRALRGEPIEIWGDGTIVRDYIYISDVIESMIAAMRYSGPELVFNIGSGEGYSINGVLDVLEDVTATHIIRRYLAGRTFDVPSNVLSIERARTILGWAPKVSFEEGLRRFADWANQDPARYT